MDYGNYPTFRASQKIALPFYFVFMYLWKSLEVEKFELIPKFEKTNIFIHTPPLAKVFWWFFSREIPIPQRFL